MPRAQAVTDPVPSPGKTDRVLMPHVFASGRHIGVRYPLRAAVSRAAFRARCAFRSSSRASWTSPIAAPRSVERWFVPSTHARSAHACRDCGTDASGLPASSSVVAKPPSPEVRFLVA